MASYSNEQVKKARNPVTKPLRIDTAPPPDLTQQLGPTLPVNNMGPTLPVNNLGPTLPIESVPEKEKKPGPSYLDFLKRGGAIGQLFGKKETVFTKPKSEGASAPAGPQPLDPFSFSSMSARDILTGDVDLSRLNTSPDDKNWAKFSKQYPDLARAITDRKDMEYQGLLEEARGKRSGVGAGAIDPMAVQLLFQNAVNPFLQNLVNGANQQTSNYESLMNQLVKSESMPEAYRSVLRTSVPQQAQGMRNMTNALAGYTVTEPSIQALMRIMAADEQAQRARVAQDRLGLAAQSGQLF